MQENDDTIWTEEDRKNEQRGRNDIIHQKRWKPTSKRAITLMNTAYLLAVDKHDAITKSRIRLSTKRPSKAVTQSQKTRKRSAEICRLKLPIFIDLLEGAYEQELRACVDLKRRLHTIFSEVEYMNNRIALLEKKQTLSTFIFDRGSSFPVEESSSYGCSDELNVNGFLYHSNPLLQISDDSSPYNSFLDLD